MRERSLDEFESIFERASIPVLDIQEVPLRRISAVLKGSPLDESVLKLAGHLRTRFSAEVHLHRAHAGAEDAPALETAGETVPAAESYAFASTAELVGQVSIARSRLVIIPEPEEEAARIVDVDRMVEGTAPPVLLIRRPVDKPDRVFHKILHGLTGNFQQTQNFAYSFTLAADGGEVLLLHTICEEDLEDVRQALQVSSDITAAGGEELLDAMTRRGERYLRAVVAATREQPYEVRYRLAVGEVVPTVKAELSRGGYGLLVVGSHSEGHSHVSADVYQLMHLVRDVPVLAL